MNTTNYKLKPTKFKDIKALIEAGKYDWKNDNIENHFELEPTKAKELTLFHFDKYISSEDAIKEMAEAGYRPATASELLLFGSQHPEVQRKESIAALGTVREVAGGRSVVYLYGHSTGRSADLCRWHGDWNGHWRFAAVRKSTPSDARKLGSSEEETKPEVETTGVADKEIFVFVCEDPEVAKEIVGKYFDKNKVTYANLIPAAKRDQIVKRINELED